MKPRTWRAALWAAYGVSGAPGLIAQVAWMRMLSAGLGHEFSALTGVLAAFFGGMALGAWLARRPRRTMIEAARLYGMLELACGCWILATVPSVSAGCERVMGWVGPEASPWILGAVGFACAFGIIGPAATAMGATLPAMERAMRPLESDGRAVSALYAWNTAGAWIGIGLAIGWLMPTHGFRATLAIAGALQVVCGACVWFVARRDPGADGCLEDRPGEDRRGASGGEGVGAWRRVVWASGFLGIGFELLGVRAVAQTTENTIRTYGWVVASVLMGTVLGAVVARRFAGSGRWAAAPAGFGALACMCGVSVVGLTWSGRWLELLGAIVGRAWAEGFVAMLAFVPPSIGMAMVYAGWVQRATDEEGTASGAVGWNCLGAALAGPVWAGIVLPATGLKGALLGVAGGYFALVPRRCWKGRFWAWPAAFAGVVGVVAAGRSFLELPPGAEVVRRWDGRLASVAVVRTADRERVLRVNNHFQQGGTATAVAARRQAHIPLLLHPGPRRALFLGVGTGITLGAAVDHPGLIAEGVELLPEVAGALAYFAPENRSVGGRSGPVVRVADARRFVRATDGTYDVIVADLFHPAEDGAGMLYTREHFGAIRRRLAEGGLFCQWLPLHQLDGDGFRDVAATFAEVFPETSLWLMRFNADVPVVGLIGGEGRLVWDGEGLARRMAAEPLASALKPLALTDPVRLWGCRLASRESLRRSSGGGAVATDDLPRVMFGAARSVYREGLPPHRTLETLFRRAEPDFRQSVGVDAAGSPWVARLEAFRIARDRHLTGLGKEIEGRMPEALEDYLASAEASADYTAGYGQAVLVASAYARENPGLARSILERLVRGRPELGLAKEMLARLSKAP